MTKHLVEYTGPTQHTRVLTEKDFNAIGRTLGEKTKATPGKPLQWDASNQWRLVLEDLHPSAIEYFDKIDPDFDVSVFDESATEPEPPSADEQLAAQEDQGDLSTEAPAGLTEPSSTGTEDAGVSNVTS